MFEKDFSSYSRSIIEKVYNDIYSQKEEYLVNTNKEELANYFYIKYYIKKVDVDTKIQYSWKEQEGYNGKYILTAKVFLKSEKEVLDYRPTQYQYDLSNRSLPTFNCNFGVPNIEWYEFNEYVDLSVLEELLQGEKRKEDYEINCFKHVFEMFFNNIEWINHDINLFNNNLKEKINNYLSDVITKANKKINIRNKLKINVMPISDIRNKKIILEVAKKQTSLSKPIPEEPYYFITNEDYDLIIKIINRCMIQYERTPSTFTTLDEEDIRNVIIGAINANFEFSSTAESFSNSGHTDIMILADNKAAFIAECKLWKGEKYVSDGIQQLINYSTYKDGKLAFLVFNKDNKNYDEIIKKMDNLIKNHPSYINTIQQDKNKWDCFFKSNHNDNVRITFLLSNYHYEKLNL